MPTRNGRRRTKRKSARRLTKDHPILIVLGALATIVTIVSGGVGVKDALSDSPNDSPAAPSVAEVAFRKDIGAICATWSEQTGPQITRDFNLLRRRLRRATSSAEQSAALVKYHQRAASRYGALLVRLSVLTPPHADLDDYRATTRAWRRGIASYRAYRDALKAAVTRRRILAVAHTADARRSALESASEVASTGLRRMGAGECSLRRTSPLPVLTLPVPTGKRPRPINQAKAVDSVALPLVDVVQPPLAAAAADEPGGPPIWLLTLALGLSVGGSVAIILLRLEPERPSP